MLRYLCPNGEVGDDTLANKSAQVQRSTVENRTRTNAPGWPFPPFFALCSKLVGNVFGKSSTHDEFTAAIMLNARVFAPVPIHGCSNIQLAPSTRHTDEHSIRVTRGSKQHIYTIYLLAHILRPAARPQQENRERTFNPAESFVSRAACAL